MSKKYNGEQMMKIRICVLISLLSILCGVVSAQDFDAQIQTAVDELAVSLKVPVEVVIEPVTIVGTETPSALSLFLYNRVEYSASKNVSKYRVVEKDRSGIRKTRIESKYQVIGINVEVMLSLIAADSNNVIGKSLLKLPTADLKKLNIEWLPENRKTQAEAVQQEQVIVEAVQQTVSTPEQNTLKTADAFTLEAWPNSGSYTFFEGDKMRISLYANKDCYFKVYYVDAQDEKQLIYPNSVNNNNRLQANKVRTIPDDTEYIMGAPFGVESIIVFASDKPLEYSESEMMPVIFGPNNPGDPTRGMKQFIVEGTGDIVETKFNYTILPQRNVEEVLSYQKADDMREFVRQLRDTIQQNSGTFNGNEREGTFITGHFNGGYKVTGNSLVFTIRHPVEESLSRGAALNTRGAGGPYNFSFSKPPNISQAVQTVRSGIEAKGGLFTGNENAGSFKVSGISGNYSIQNAVAVTILEKPFIISNSLIEKEVKNFFGVK
ncbi:hypothetical protein AGMMS50268_09890 [Spirochaetia bacterium]|nr:hypothetical protein AGMMS50268_09890 [Spirochaetia bacterium]